MERLAMPRVSYLLKEEISDEISILDAKSGEALTAKKGATYTVLNATDLDPVELILAVRQGNALIITLPDGATLKLEGFFPDGVSRLEDAFARFSDVTTVEFKDKEEEEGGSGFGLWGLWGLGGAAVLGSSYLLSDSGSGDGTDISVSVDAPQPTTNDSNPSLFIEGISNQVVEEGKSFSANAPSVTNAKGNVTWRLEGEDSQFFSIDETTGVVSRNQGFNFEDPKDSGRDNLYRYTIVATDSEGNQVRKSVEVLVEDVTELATLNLDSLSDTNLPENEAFTWSLPDLPDAIGKVRWILSGDDAAYFTVDEAARLIRFEPKDFESPKDLDRNNTYSVRLTAVDDDNNSVSKLLDVFISDATEVSQLIVGGLNNSAVLESMPLTFAAPIVSGAVGTPQWEIIGDDASYFSVDAATGLVSFLPKDYESPEDADGDNVYSAVMLVRDQDGNEASRPFSISVVNRPESTTESGAPSEDESLKKLSISNIPDRLVQELEGVQIKPILENAEGSLTWSIEGPDANEVKEIFTIDPSTGVINFKGQDFEGPIDVNADNIYEVIVRAEDSTGGVATQTLKISVVDDQREVVIDAGSGSVEPYPALLIVRENDVLNIPAPSVVGDESIYWRLSGADARYFDIDNYSGVVSSKTNLDFEKPLDLDLDNRYQIQLIGVAERKVTISDVLAGLDLTPEQSMSIHSLSLKSGDGLGGISIDSEVGRQLLAVGSQIDVDALRDGNVIYTPVAGEPALFRFDLLDSNGEKISVAEVNFEPQVGYKHFTTIQVVDQNEGVQDDPEVVSGAEVVIQSAAGSNVDYPTEIVIREGEANALDLPLPGLAGVEDPSASIEWSLSGDDSKHFDIDSDGVVTLNKAFDFEQPSDLNKDNLYRVTLIGKSGDEIVKHPLEIRVSDVNEVVDPNDTSAPSLVKIFSNSEQRVFGFEEEVIITAVFNKPVVFMDNAISPSLKLSNGKDAEYHGGNGTYQITFSYTVEADDYVDGLDVSSVLVGSLRSINGIDFSEMVIDSIGSNLSDYDQIILDASPKIIGLDSTSSPGVYGMGSKINLVMMSDQPIFVEETDGYPAILALNNGGEAVYKDGSGSNQLLFEYLVGQSEDVVGLDVLAFAENDFIFKNEAGLILSDSLSRLSQGSFEDNTDISIGEPEVPSIIDIVVNQADGTYILGDRLNIDLIFNDAVWVKNGSIDFDALDQSTQDALRPYLSLNTGGVAHYEGGSGTTTLRFIYDLKAGDLSDDLDVISLAENGADLVNDTGSAVRTAVAPGTLSSDRDLKVDADPPKLLSIFNEELVRETVTIAGKERVKVGGTLTLSFNDNIEVVGSDAKLILSGVDDLSNPQYPALGTYIGHNSEGKTIEFQYEGLLMDEYIPLDVTAIIENSTKILDLAGNNAQTRISLGVNDVAGTLLAGAGEFISDQLGLRLLDHTGVLLLEKTFNPRSNDVFLTHFLPENYSNLVMIELFDANADEPDYLDEFTGQLKSLSYEENLTPTTFRLVLHSNSLENGDPGVITLTPFGELAVRLVEYVRTSNDQEIFPLTEDYLLANELVQNLFMLESITSGDIKFTTDNDFSPVDGISSAEQYGLGLSLLSTLDSESGSIGKTLDNILIAWAEEVSYAQAGLESPGILENYLSLAGDLLAARDTGSSAVSHADVIKAYLKRVIGQISETDADAESAMDIPLDDPRLSIEEDNPRERGADDVNAALGISIEGADDTKRLDVSTDEESLNAPMSQMLNTDSSGNIDSSILLLESSVSLSSQIDLLINELVSSNDPVSLQSLSYELAAYTAAARIRDVLLLGGSEDAKDLIADYQHLGFERINSSNVGLVNTVIKTALQNGAVGDLMVLVQSALSDFEDLLTLVTLSDSAVDNAVFITEDPTARLSILADKLDEGLGDSDYDDVLVGFLREQMYEASSNQVLATYEAQGTELLRSIMLPSELLSGLSSSDFLSVEGRDVSGNWIQIESFTSSDVLDGVVTLSPSYQGFDGFRLLASTPLDSVARESMVGSMVTFSSQVTPVSPENIDIAGLSQLCALPVDMAVQLAQWSGVETWDGFQVLDSLSPVISSLRSSYVAIHGDEPVASELKSLFRLGLSLSDADGLPMLTEMISHVGSFSETDLELLAGAELDFGSLSSILFELKAMYHSGDAVSDVLSYLQETAWLEESQRLLSEPNDILVDRLMAISADGSFVGDRMERELARLSSVVKFRQFLSGEADADAVSFTQADYQSFGFAEVTSEQVSLLTRFLLQERDVSSFDLKALVNDFQIRYAEASEAFDALLSDTDEFEERVVLAKDDNLSSLFSLISSNFDENSSTFKGLMDTITSYMFSADRSLATLDIDGVSVSYIDLLDSEGMVVAGDIPLYATLYESESSDGQRVELIADSEVGGRYWLPDTVGSLEYARLEIGVTGYSASIDQLAEARVSGSVQSLLADHLSLFGYDYDAQDAIAIERMAEAAIKVDTELSLGELFDVYDAVRPMLAWGNQSVSSADNWEAMWQWGSYLRENPDAMAGLNPITGRYDFNLERFSESLSDSLDARPFSGPIGNFGTETLLDLGVDYNEFLFDRNTGQPIWSFDDPKGPVFDGVLEAVEYWGASYENEFSNLRSIENLIDPNFDWSDIATQIDLGDVY